MVFDAGNEFGRLVEIVKIFIKLNSYGVADLPRRRNYAVR
jgi:hypothetical protein